MSSSPSSPSQKRDELDADQASALLLPRLGGRSPRVGESTGTGRVCASCSPGAVSRLLFLLPAYGDDEVPRRAVSRLAVPLRRFEPTPEWKLPESPSPLLSLKIKELQALRSGQQPGRVSRPTMARTPVATRQVP